MSDRVNGRNVLRMLRLSIEQYNIDKNSECFMMSSCRRNFFGGVCCKCRLVYACDRFLTEVLK